MKHQDFCKKERYYEDSYLEIKESQEEMIRRHYSDYNSNKWVFWIVSELFHIEDIDALSAYITIKKKDGANPITVSTTVRQPYPNKRIYQQSMKSGHKRLYGIPLIFETFEELTEISEVIIKWEIFSGYILENIHEYRPFELMATQLIVKYNLSFEKDNKNPDYRFFTLFSKDESLYNFDNRTDYEDAPEKFQSYCSEFDSIFDHEDKVILDPWEFIYPETAAATSDPYFEEFKHSFPDKKDIPRILKTLNEGNYLIKQEITRNLMMYEKTETLKAEYMADISPQKAYGFKNK